MKQRLVGRGRANGHAASAREDVLRRVVVIRGRVQGVGFRPYVHGLATRLRLGGFVRNREDAVLIEVEGRRSSVEAFVESLREEAPPVACIQELNVAEVRPLGEISFEIAPSEELGARGTRFLTPDVATCADCLRELLDPADRRYRYPFINCARCGPRLTIIHAAPYDRERTTMDTFPMCSACRAEYVDPRDRRFHAEVIACPDCGPTLTARGANGCALDVEPLSFVAECLLSDGIVAVKGLGGYHLACDATSEAAVERLRGRKHRDAKPFAVMVPDLASARELCRVSSAEAELLSDARAPIVLLRRLPGAPVADAAAPNSPVLGLMLPYTPLHHLLARAIGARPIVLTSGNRSDEPIAFEDDDALERLRGIADAFLTHNRPIRVRCDDSVARLTGGGPSLVRRSRGYAPDPIRLPFDCRQRVLALGGHLKNTFALGRGRYAFLSHHLGDLGDHGSERSFREAILHYESLFGLEPEVLVHDLHPEYATTDYAKARQAGGAGAVTLVAVQHHHAHMASCMAENGVVGPAIGVTLDGTGYGSDGSLWGGEFLVGDYRSFRRAAHFRAVALPGGERAIREPWRTAVAHVLDCGEDPEPLLDGCRSEEVRVVRRMIERRFNCPQTTSVGRLFDAVSALLGVRSRSSFEAQAAMELEALALGSDADDCFPVVLERGDDGIVVDTRSILRAVLDAVRRGTPLAQVARQFHNTIAQAVARVASCLRDETGILDVVLSGGVFQNVLLLERATSGLTRLGLRVHAHAGVPANDGGLCLGQLAVAAALYEGGP